MYSPSLSHDVDNFNNGNTTHLDSKTGFAGKVAVGHYFLPMLALELGAGYFQSKGSPAAEPGKTMLKVVPVVATERCCFHLVYSSPTACSESAPTSPIWTCRAMKPQPIQVTIKPPLDYTAVPASTSIFQTACSWGLKENTSGSSPLIRRAGYQAERVYYRQQIYGIQVFSLTPYISSKKGEHP